MRVLCAAVFFMLAAVSLLCPVQTADASGLPESVWRDSDRSQNRKPRPEKAPRVQPGSGPQVAIGIDLKPEDTAARDAVAKREAVAAAPFAATDSAGNAETRMLAEQDWRLGIQRCAVAHGDMVTLGEIAVPLGSIPPETWAELSVRELWPAPPHEGKPLQVNKSRLTQALRKALGSDLLGRCVIPASITLQRGGIVFTEDDLRQYVVNSLTPMLASMPGKAEFSDFRLPPYIFMEHAQQQVQLEPGKLVPGRVPLRFAVQEVDGRVLRRVSGSVTLNVWLDVPTASRQLQRGDTLQPEDITFTRVNASALRETPWDGKGGPWQLARPVMPGTPVLQSDLMPLAMVRKGAVVTLVYERGALRMQTKAEALEDGAPGGSIQVRNLQSKKQVYATVIDGSTVIIR